MINAAEQAIITTISYTISATPTMITPGTQGPIGASLAKMPGTGQVCRGIQSLFNRTLQWVKDAIAYVKESFHSWGARLATQTVVTDTASHNAPNAKGIGQPSTNPFDPSNLCTNPFDGHYFFKAIPNKLFEAVPDPFVEKEATQPSEPLADLPKISTNPFDPTNIVTNPFDDNYVYKSVHQTAVPVSQPTSTNPGDENIPAEDEDIFSKFGLCG